MDFQHSERATALRKQIDDFTDPCVCSRAPTVQVHGSGDPRMRYRTPPVLQQLNVLAREQGCGTCSCRARTAPA